MTMDTRSYLLINVILIYMQLMHFQNFAFSWPKDCESIYNKPVVSPIIWCNY